MTWWWPNDGWMKKLMKLICPDANSGPSEQKLKFVNLGHVEEISFVTVPFCKRQICVFGFVCMSDAFFVKLFDRLCASVHPWGHGERRGGFFDPPNQLETLAQLLVQLKHLPSFTQWTEKDFTSWSSQVDDLSNLMSHIWKLSEWKIVMWKCCRSHALHHQGEFLQFIIQFVTLMWGFSAISAPQCSRDLMSNAV